MNRRDLFRSLGAAIVAPFLKLPLPQKLHSAVGRWHVQILKPFEEQDEFPHMPIGAWDNTDGPLVRGRFYRKDDA